MRTRLVFVLAVLAGWFAGIGVESLAADPIRVENCVDVADGVRRCVLVTP